MAPPINSGLFGSKNVSLSNFGQSVGRKHSAFEHYQHMLWYQVSEFAMTLFLGTAWYIIIYATFMTMWRVIRCYYKIRWTESDDRQMRDYMTSSFIGRLAFFLLLQIGMTLLWSKLEFTSLCLHQGFYGVVAILSYLGLKALHSKVKYGRWGGKRRYGDVVYASVSTKDD